jgi:molybdopterin-biosynthesis enzyme MoeA-like protein
MSAIAAAALSVPRFGAIIIGDEILSGRRVDKHLPFLIDTLGRRGWSLAYAHHIGDDRALITAELTRAFAGADVVFSFGGIGATPDDHTRQCAAAALGQPLALHPQAKALITERMMEMAAQQGTSFDPENPNNVHRLNMGMFPESADIIPNPYNKIPGFQCVGAGGGRVYFVPGFPVMAWPMVDWVLDTYYAQYAAAGTRLEKSLIVFGAMEATLTPLMEQIENDYPDVKVFSLPSVDHPEYGRHIDLGVKGLIGPVEAAFAALKQGLSTLGVRIGTEMVR